MLYEKNKTEKLREDLFKNTTYEYREEKVWS